MEKINFIQSLTEAARTEIRNSFGFDFLHQVFYITIGDLQEVKIYKTVTEIPFQSVALLFCAQNYLYKHYGSTSVVKIYATLDVRQNPLVIDSIRFSKWTLKELKVESIQIGKLGKCKALFSLNTSPADQIEYEVDSSDRLQHLWDFFIALNEYDTLKEAIVLMRYYKHKAEEDLLNISLSDYQREIESKDHLINQYKSLIDRIESLVSTVRISD